MKQAISDFARAIPATGRLVYRLVRDDRVDARTRAAVVAALGYTLLPFDLIPDRIPVIGRLDDLVIGAAAIQALFSDAGDEILREHWDASDGSLEALLGVVDTVGSLVPKPLRHLLRLRS